MECWHLGIAYTISLAFILQMASGRPIVGPLGGPYLFIPKQVADCTNKGTNELRIVSSKLSKIGRDTYSYTTDVILPYGLTDEITIGIRCAVNGNGGWKENAFNFHFGQACTTAKKIFPEVYELVKKEFGSFEDCPIPPGNYTIRNAIYKPSSLKAFPSILYGQYRTDFYYQKNGKRIGCKRIIFDVVPKKTL